MPRRETTCYVDVWREPNFQGECVRLNGPGEYPNLKFGPDNWGDCIGSLRVGPGAFIQVYEDKNFKDTMIAFLPGQEVANLAEHKFDDQIDSIRLIDSIRIFDRARMGSEDGLPSNVSLTPRRRVR
jgi:hypothetical protein